MQLEIDWDELDEIIEELETAEEGYYEYRRDEETISTSEETHS